MPAKLPTHKPKVAPGKSTDKERANAQSRARSKSRFYSTSSKEWRTIRNAQLTAYPMCEGCGKVATEVHHRTNDTSRNLIGDELASMCKGCHSSITMTDANAERKSRAGSQTKHVRPGVYTQPQIVTREPKV